MVTKKRGPSGPALEESGERIDALNAPGVDRAAPS